MTISTEAGARIQAEATGPKAKEYRAQLEACLQQSVPDYDAIPQAYILPQLGLTKDTLPADFAYRPATRRLTELEATNLFLVSNIHHQMTDSCSSIFSYVYMNSTI